MIDRRLTQGFYFKKIIYCASKIQSSGFTLFGCTPCTLNNKLLKFDHYYLNTNIPIFVRTNIRIPNKC